MLVQMPSDNELLEWMRKNYGDEWAVPEKIELARMLWKKKYGSKYVSEVRREYVPINIGDIDREGYYKIKGIVIDFDKVTYKGCPVCKRSVKRGCKHLSSGEVSPETLVRLNFVVNDGTGDARIDSVWVLRDVPGVGFGDLVDVFVYYKKSENFAKFYVNKIEVVKKVSEGNGDDVSKTNGSDSERKDNDGYDDFGFSYASSKGGKINYDEVSDDIIKLLRLVKKFNGIKVQVFKKMVERNGIKYDVVEKFVRVEEDKVKLNDVGLELVS